MSKLDILHVISKLDRGGVENALVRLVEGLNPARFQSIVCCIKSGGAAVERLKQRGVRVEVLNKMQRRGFDVGAIRALRGVIRDAGPDVIVTYQYHASLYGRLAGIMEGRGKLIGMSRSAYMSPSAPKLHRRILENLLARRTSAVVAVSEAVRADVIKYAGIAPGKVHVIHNGVDLGRFKGRAGRDAARARMGLPAGVFVVGTVGRFTPEKNHAGLIEAVSRTGRAVHAAVAGDGPLRGEVEGIARRLGVPLTVTGWLERESVAEFLSALDVFCFPSLWEGFSNALLEAMASGLPIAASDIPSNREMLGDAAVFVPCGDTGALAGALAGLYGDDALRARLSEAALRRAPGFSIQKMIGRYEALFEEVAARKDP